MEIKKAPHVDLEKQSLTSLLLGLVVGISVLFVALEWRTPSGNNLIQAATNAFDREDTMLIEDQPEEQKPEDPAPQQEQQEAQLPDVFNVVDDNKEVAKINFENFENAKDVPPPPQLPSAPPQEEVDEIFEFVEEPTEFPGGQGELNKYLSKSIRYPELAIDNGIQGRVVVTFVIERNGKPSNVKVLRGVDPSLDKEAIRVVENMPAWKPGMQQGKPVRQRFNLPVVFRLQ